MNEQSPLRVTAALERLIQEGGLEPDAAQRRAAMALDRLETELVEARGGLFRKPRPVQGLYIWGPVGRGKSMLMDLFFKTVPVRLKTRAHFHQFMQNVHSAIHVERRRRQSDPIPRVAADIASRSRLICFDEFQVADIADAMILGRLFEALFAGGVTVVATSNRHPDDLYKDGLKRDNFLPFIELFKQHMRVHELSAEKDYRLDRLSAASVYHAPMTPPSRAAFEAAWSRVTGGQAEEPVALMVQGRVFEARRAAAGAARFTFAELCDRPLGPADYLALAQRFHTVFLENIPALDPGRRDIAKRFVTLIDALYEAKTKLVALAEVEPDALYPKGDGSFEFQRTASRLHEMRSQAYLAQERAAAAAEA